MGNIPICNCIINISKDVKKENFHLDDLENEKEKILNFNDNIVNNSETSKEIPQKKNIENKIKNFQKISKDNNNNYPVFATLKNDFSPNNINSNRNKVIKEYEIKPRKNTTGNSTMITLVKKNKEIKEEEKEKEKKDKEIKEKEKKDKEILEKEKKDKEILEKEKKDKEILEKEKKKKERKKIEKSKYAKTIIICGPNESGKTSFSMRYCDNKFDNCYIPSLINEISSKNIILNNGEQRLQLKFIVTNNIDNLEDVDCYFVIYDINSKKSFIEAKNLVEDKILIEKLPIFFIGNKSDLKSVVNKFEVEDFCKTNKLYNMIISVKNNIGISALIKKFTELFKYDE